MSPSLRNPPRQVECNRLVRGKKYRACVINQGEQQPEDDRIVSFRKIVDIELGIQDEDGEEICETEWVFHLEEPIEHHDYYLEPSLEWVVPDAFIHQIRFYEYEDDEEDNVEMQRATAGLQYYDGMPIFHYELN